MKSKTVVKVIYKRLLSELFIKIWHKDIGSISKVIRLSGQNWCTDYIPRNNYSKIPHIKMERLPESKGLLKHL